MGAEEPAMIARIALALALATAAAAAQNDAETVRFKVTVGGEPRKAGLLLPKDVKKNEIFPLVVAVPDTEGAAFKELDPWAVYAIKHRFVVVSVDSETPKGWAYNELLAMQRDTEAIEAAIEVAKTKVAVDDSAIVIHGHLGGTYPTLWMGVRRPDLFLGVAANSCVYYAQMGPTEKELPNLNLHLPILLSHGELDTPRMAKETQLAHTTLKEAGFDRIVFRIVPKAINVPNLDSFVEWYLKLLKETEKPRKAQRKAREAMARLRAELAAGLKPATLKELDALAEQELASGFKSGAVDLRKEVVGKAQETLNRAKTAEENRAYVDAVALYKEVADAYLPLGIAKEAAKERQRLLKSDDYKADEILREALRLKESGHEEKAVSLLEKILEQFPHTPAAEQAKRLVG